MLPRWGLAVALLGIIFMITNLLKLGMYVNKRLKMYLLKLCTYSMYIIGLFGLRILYNNNNCSRLIKNYVCK